MALKSKALLFAMAALLLVSNTLCEMSQKSKDKVNAGISGGQAVVDFISKFGDPKTSKFFNAVEKLSSFLGAAGGLISFALLFVPQSDSAELTYMTKKFAEVNGKLDVITSELDNVKALITYENQRAVYVGSASKILFGQKQLGALLNELENTPCGDEKDCSRKRARIATRYVDDLNVKAHIFKIVNAAIKPTSAFGDPLLVLMKNTFNCDVGKIDHLANSILKLSFKAQQAILAYEKLTGSNDSITQSMNDWLKSMYALRKSVYDIKMQCNNAISSYMIADISDKKYQVNVRSNAEANREVKKFMDEKYNWLKWVAYSYEAYGGSKHCVTNVYGAFWNMPRDKNDRKRNLIVSFTDKSGTYANQKYIVLKAVDDVVCKTDFYSVRSDACKLLSKVTKELRKEGVWNYVTSINILKQYSGLVINASNDLTYISEEYTIKSYYKNTKGHQYTLTDKVRLVIILKSVESANGLVCHKSCGIQGSCAHPPYSCAKYCQCKPYYQGDSCNEHAQAHLALTMDSMLETTLKLPMLSDVAYDIKDLREYVGISFGEVQSAISQLEDSIKKAFDDLHRKLTNQFQWSNLITQYSDSVKKIEFYAYRFKELPNLYNGTIFEIEGKKLATAVLATDGIQKWLYDLNYLFTGRTGVVLVKHEPLLIVFMNRYHSLACSPAYKAAVDNTWRQLVLLQQIGFMLWAQALEFMNRPMGHTGTLYKSRTTNQVNIFKQKTCEYKISNSVNVQCSGGKYLHPGLKIKNQCKANYFITGNKETTCLQQNSGCSACNCSAAGSNGAECLDASGKCSCKSGFYGLKCQNRNCLWSQWSAYSSCSKSCDYGGKSTKTRSHQITKQGQGNSCSGSSSKTTSCFNRCCSNQFHCLNKKKCIPSSYKCNYDNNCGDKQDETLYSCNEKCTTKYTRWNSHGGGDMVYFDRHRLNCGGSGNVLKMFRLQRSGSQIRFQYTCCTLTKPVCSNKKKRNHYTYDGDGNTVYLDRQKVSCGDHAYLNDFWLERNSGHNYVRYSYYCCELKHSKHRGRTSCYTPYTSFTYDGNGKSYYLDRQTVQCHHRYFLTYFWLIRHRSHDRWRYLYRCCQIRP